MLRRALGLAGTAALIAGAVQAETTRSLKVQLTGDAGAAFAVENLAGSMTVVAGDGDAVVAVATVHADDAKLADAMRFEQVRGEEGVPTLRVVYPLDRERRIRYRPTASGSDGRGRHGSSHWFFGFGWDGSEVKYDGHRVRVSEDHGVLLYADVEVRVPRRALAAKFRNCVGPVSATGVEGRLLLDTGNGDVTATRLSGDVKADTGSGDVRASAVKGRFVCDTGSGACIVNGFDGTELSCDTGSGQVRVADVKADRLLADTGSGDVLVERSDVEDFRGDTGSGGIEAELTGTRLRRIKADTGSGHVTLRLPPEVSFELAADQGSGDLECGFHDAQPVKSGRKIVGYRRGEARVRIDIDTGSGDAAVNPAR
jgi:hypothetical protein